MNIYDVSNHARVSIATVSRVINGNPNVSEKTRNRVLAVMKEMGYTPNVFARGLGLNSMKTVGILCADASDPWLAEAVCCLEKELRAGGYDSLLCCTGYLAETKKKYLKLLLSKRVDAILLTGSHYIEAKPEDNAYLLEAARDVPLMMVNGCLEREPVYSAVCDDEGAVYEAVLSLYASGRSAVAYLYSGNSYSNLRKLSGYYKALEDAGQAICKERVILCPKDLDEAAGRLLELQKAGVHFDAVMAAEDVLAVGAVKYAQAAGLKIPEEVSIIGYNNSILCRCTAPELTSVNNRVNALCTAAAGSLMKVLAGESIPFQTTLAPELIKRGTTDF